MRTLLLLALLAGCAKPAPPPAPPAAPPPATDLPCPAGTLERGAAPPKGLEAWCSRTLPNGQQVKDGPAKTWHSATVEASEGSYYADKKRGEWRYWHTNGAIAKIEHWRDGKLHGPYVEYAANGQKTVEGAYLQGQPDGPWTWWSSDGWMQRTGSYDDDGEKDGEWLQYRSDGSVSQRQVFRDGQQLQQQFFVEKPAAPAPATKVVPVPASAPEK